MLNNTSKQQNKYFGRIGEDLACDFLKGKGFVILTRNYQRKWGELDIVGFKDDMIHFFEVKSTTSNFIGLSDTHRPEENVHGLKIKHIRRMIETYLNENSKSLNTPFSFHVLSVYINSDKKIGKIDWIRDIIL